MKVDWLYPYRKAQVKVPMFNKKYKITSFWPSLHIFIVIFPDKDTNKTSSLYTSFPEKVTEIFRFSVSSRLLFSFLQRKKE